MDLQKELWEVQRIGRAVSFRSILNVPFDATPRAIKNAYLELARIVHPDNARIRQYLRRFPNRENEFKQAFQRVQQAYRNLNSDNGGVADGDNNATADDDNNATADDDNNATADDDNNATADDDDVADDDDDNDGDYAWSNWWKTSIGFRTLVCSPFILLIVLPIICACLLWIATPLYAPDPIFRLKRDSEFVTKNHTGFGKILYFVRVELQFKTEFREMYDTWNELDLDVIDAYEHKLHVKCNRENIKDKLLEEARISGNRKTYMEATLEGTPSCDKLEKIRTWKQSNPRHFNKWHPIAKFLKYFNLSSTLI